MKVKIIPECLANVRRYMSGHSYRDEIDLDTVFEVRDHEREIWYHITGGLYSGWNLMKTDFYVINLYNFKEEIERILEC